MKEEEEAVGDKGTGRKGAKTSRERARKWRGDEERGGGGVRETYEKVT